EGVCGMLNSLGWAELEAGRPDAALRWFEDGEKAAGGRPDLAHWVGISRGNRAAALVRLARREEDPQRACDGYLDAARLAAEGLTMCLSARHDEFAGSCGVNLASALYRAGDLDRADRCAEEARAALQRGSAASKLGVLDE